MEDSMAELPNPFHKAETIIIGIVCLISTLLTVGEVVYAKFIKAPLPVQIGVGVALIVLVVWLVRIGRTKSD